EDVIRVASANDPANTTAIASIPHLPGYVSRGAVSPDGSHLALVVADSGTQANPVASLQRVNLETGDITRLLTGLHYLQDPVWAPGSDAVVVTLESEDGPIQVLSVPVDGSQYTVLRTVDALGVYPVAYDPEGRLVSVIVDGRG